MFVDFYAFPSEKALQIVTKIESIGFNVFVSDDPSMSWLNLHFDNEKRYRLYYDMFEIVGGTKESYPFEKPILAISATEDGTKWEEVDDWVKGFIFNEHTTSLSTNELGFDKPSVQRRKSEKIGEETVIDGEKVFVLSTPPSDIDLKNGYKFQCHHDEMLDTKYYEVIAPSSETPFTVVVYNFSKKDDSYFFSDIWASNAWGRNRMESRYDYDFLVALWKHLKMPGEFTMDVVKRRVDACYPDRVKDINELESEPTVYRRAMSQVTEMKRKFEQEFITNSTQSL